MSMTLAEVMRHGCSAVRRASWDPRWWVWVEDGKLVATPFCAGHHPLGGDFALGQKFTTSTIPIDDAIATDWVRTSDPVADFIAYAFGITSEQAGNVNRAKLAEVARRLAEFIDACEAGGIDHRDWLKP